MPGNKGFRYVYSPKHIKNMMNKIQNTGRPDKLNSSYIKNVWLFKNDQYSAVLDILKDMEFINGSGKPSQLYAKYQNPTVAKIALAEGIKSAYPDLFKAYPNANSLPKADIEGYFKQQTGKTGSVFDKIMSTFSTLCGLADFSSTEAQVEEIEALGAHEDLGKEKFIPEISLEPKIQVNIGINIAADTPDDKIKVIFENMKKYLLSRKHE